MPVYQSHVNGPDFEGVGARYKPVDFVGAAEAGQNSAMQIDSMLMKKQEMDQRAKDTAFEQGTKLQELSDRRQDIAFTQGLKVQEFAMEQDTKKQDLAMRMQDNALKQQEVSFNMATSTQKMALERDRIRMEAAEKTQSIIHLQHQNQLDDTLAPLQVEEARLKMEKLKKENEIRNLTETPEKIDEKYRTDKALAKLNQDKEQMLINQIKQKTEYEQAQQKKLDAYTSIQSKIADLETEKIAHVKEFAETVRQLKHNDPVEETLDAKPISELLQPTLGQTIFGNGTGRPAVANIHNASIKEAESIISKLPAAKQREARNRLNSDLFQKKLRDLSYNVADSKGHADDVYAIKDLINKELLGRDTATERLIKTEAQKHKETMDAIDMSLYGLEVQAGVLSSKLGGIIGQQKRVEEYDPLTGQTKEKLTTTTPIDGTMGQTSDGSPLIFRTER